MYGTDLIKIERDPLCCLHLYSLHPAETEDWSPLRERDTEAEPLTEA